MPRFDSVGGALGEGALFTTEDVERGGITFLLQRLDISI